METNETPCPCWPDGNHRRYLENEGKCQCEVEPENYPRADVVTFPIEEVPGEAFDLDTLTVSPAEETECAVCADRVSIDHDCAFHMRRKSGR